MNKIYLYFALGVFLTSIFSCKSEYTNYVEREREKGIINDSLIFGMTMGQTQKDFYAICWQLNHDKLISQGSGNSMAKYNEVLDSTADQTLKKEMEFYGIFDENKVMRGMDMIYRYTSWAPWNKGRQSDSLAINLKHHYSTEYKGNDFISIDLDNVKYKAYVKIDGNRQILIYPKTERDVAVKIEDLRYKYSKNGN